MLKGLGASPGIAIGKVLIKQVEELNIEKKAIDNPEAEINHLNASLEKATEQIQSLHDHTLKNIGKDEAEIFSAHLMMLQDPEVFGQVRSKIQEEKVNAVWALKQVVDQFVSMFELMDNEYLRERAADLKDVATRVTRILLDVEVIDLTSLEDEVVLLAEDLTPSDTAQINKDKVLGFATEIGGKTSHSAIMARTLELPAIVGCDGLLEQAKNGDKVVFDGETGELYLNPSEDIIKKYQKSKEDYAAFRAQLDELKGSDTISKDGVRVELAANIGTPKDLDGVIKNDGEGIGLYRSEFLYMDREQLPTEDEQFEAYKSVAEGMDGKPVVIRTLDVGGDKELPYLDLPKEMNPFLGYRAIRLCLDQTNIFKTQLRALLRASAYGNIKIMFPMISSVEEVRAAKAIVREVMTDLTSENIAFNKDIELGMMIEIPAAAIISDQLAKEVDFFSIGTNDLIQYTTAVDRMNKKISYLYSQFHPALLRLIKMVIENGHREGIWVGMCGEVAGDPKMIPVLLGLGLDEFSMSPISILKARGIIKDLDSKEMKALAEELVMLPTSEEVEKRIDEALNNN